MSANTLTGLVPTIYQALDTLSRELVGFIPAVSRDVQAKRAAVGQTVRSPVIPALAAEDATPANVSPQTSGSTVTYKDMTISKSRVVPFNFNGDETLGLGDMASPVNAGMIAQALRTITNEIETDIGALHIGASRAYGTAGTDPFGTAADFSDFAQTTKILDDNGAPAGDRHLVLSTGPAANLRGKQSNLFKVNEAGGDSMLRRGDIGEIEGFKIGVSGKVATHTAGAGSSDTVAHTGGYAVGTTSIVTSGFATGDYLAGDVVKFGSATDLYVVASADPATETIVLAAPGLVASVAHAATITKSVSGRRNMAFSRDAIQLAIRLPALPNGGDSADDRMEIVDPVSGMRYEFAIYKQYRQVRYEVGASWGVAVNKTAHLALLLGK